jgi:hypothetical protein
MVVNLAGRDTRCLVPIVPTEAERYSQDPAHASRPANDEAGTF